MKRITAILVCLTVILSVFPLAVFGDSDKTYSIKNVDDLLKLSEKCNIDSYSVNMTVELEADIDLSGSGFTSIPYFCGSFNGNGFTVKNFSVKSDGSHMGFFRYVSEGAFVSGLNLECSVAPSGSGCFVGGLAGENNGIISDCNVSGKVSGVQYIGGVTGRNTGTVSGCTFDGSVLGEHQVGGIVGENSGIVMDCTNKGKINTTAIVTSSSTSSLTSFDFDIAELSEDDFLDITDIGGIAGYSDSIIQKCQNKGSVGYEHTGYNVGGIVGRECGYVSECVNNADVLGRKDAGGIVGQLEPYTAWDFSESKLTKLDEELKKLDNLIDELSSDVGSTSEDLSDNIENMHRYIDDTSNDTKNIINQTSENIKELDTATTDIMELLSKSISEHKHEKTRELLDELEAMIKNDEVKIDISELFSLLQQITEEETTHVKENHKLFDFELTDRLEEIISEVTISKPDSSSLFNNFENVMSSIQYIKDNFSTDSKEVKDDINAISEQCTVISDTFFSTVENVAEVNVDYENDVSLTYSEKYNTGIIDSCKNYSEINAETNVGGIVGTVSYEVDFDMEDKLNISEYLLSDAKYMVFAVIRNSESYDGVTAKKKCAGGIAGNMDFGAVINSVGSGTITVTNGDYCGGIAGSSKGNIKNCSSRTLLSGGKYVGGIVGNGENVSECKSYSFVSSGSEYIGSIAGNINGSVEKSIFVENEVGAVDSISYSGTAEPVTYEEMLKIKGLPEVFKKIVVTFIAENEVVEEKEVPFGGSIDKLPDVPMNGVQYWKWDDFNNEHIYYSLTVNGQYYNPKTTISTDEEIPLFLVEGNFYEGQKLTVEEFTPEGYGSEFLPEDIICAYTLEVNDYKGNFNVRMKTSDKGVLYVIDANGKYIKTDYEVDGSYIVFDARNGSSVVWVNDSSNQSLIIIICVSAAVVILAAVIIIIAVKHGKKKKNNKIKKDKSK